MRADRAAKCTGWLSLTDHSDRSGHSYRFETERGLLRSLVCNAHTAVKVFPGMPEHKELFGSDQPASRGCVYLSSLATDKIRTRHAPQPVVFGGWLRSAFRVQLET
jgi:hypothetical protein